MCDIIGDLVRAARRRWPALADDLEQEMRVATWLASAVSNNRWYIRLRARGALLDYLRDQTKSRRSWQPAFLEVDVDDLADDFREPSVDVEMNSDLALLCAVALNDQITVAKAFGLSKSRMCRKVKAARGRVATSYELTAEAQP